jgi:hypothetical protein
LSLARRERWCNHSTSTAEGDCFIDLFQYDAPVVDVRRLDFADADDVGTELGGFGLEMAGLEMARCFRRRGELAARRRNLSFESVVLIVVEGRSICLWNLRAVDDEDFDRATLGVELQSEILPQCRQQRWTV